MTHHNPDSHLTYDELLRSMTDTSDLDPRQQAHLKSCRHCRRQTEELTHRYHRLGQMARQMAPAPRRVFRVPERRPSLGRWYFKPGMALGVLGILIFVFTLWGPRFTGDSPTPGPTMAWHFEDDDRLMEEIDALVEDALPGAYQQMAALSDDRSVEDLDEFIDWMVPAPEEGDGVERPVTSDRDSRLEPLARSELAVLEKEGMV